MHPHLTLSTAPSPVAATPPPVRGRRGRAAAGAVALLLALSGTAACGGSSAGGQALPTPAVTLPPGDLVELVPQPEQVPEGLVPLLAQTGPADVDKIASFSSNATKARTALVKHGFTAGYVVEYADTDTGQVWTVVVTRFATVAGATDDLTADLAAATSKDVRPLVLSTVGDQSGATKQRLPGGSKDAELVTIRFRVGDTTWLLGVGARGPVDEGSVRTIAESLAQRGAALATASATSPATGAGTSPGTGSGTSPAAGSTTSETPSASPAP